ncbi:M48 metallopeptidase family protein [Devriesea agamarum]|uniref:M48 metallopeptidase family protein n=1 Tax=Devriesea agamarum TaxID=472569 RepID=UPI000AE07677|nr:M48 family metallopeptidase [Devriesea agamarum]
MVARLARRDSSRNLGDAELMDLATRLSREYLDSLAVPVSVTWSTRQNSRWGSCTPADGTIRLSSRLRTMPAWVFHYVLLHELTHLLVPDHGPDFWAWMQRYPRAERARGFLEGVAFARDQPDANDVD